MKICVVGGGPAGMMAAIAAGRRKADVILIEKNEKLGKKLFLTGKGRCNLTNSCAVEELFDNVVRNPKFMYSAFYSFDNGSTVEFFEKLGLKLKTERGNRVFPSSDHSSDVIKVLRNEIERLGIDYRLNNELTDIACEDNKISSVIVKNSYGKIEKLSVDSVIFATGGCSYSSTGSDGKLFDILKKHGIDYNELYPSLIPLVSESDYVTRLQGISLKNVRFTLKSEKREVFSGFGEMLFTQFCVSVPLVLSASAFLKEKDYENGLYGIVDLKPALSFEELDARILREFEGNSNKILGNIIPKLVPAKMTDSVLKLARIDYNRKINGISKEERMALVETLKGFSFPIMGCRDINEAIITRGGICVKEINPQTMESKKVKGLYFAGEMIDVDALTGGFNLQIAWSTGFLAGSSAAKNLMA